MPSSRSRYKRLVRRISLKDKIDLLISKFDFTSESLLPHLPACQLAPRRTHSWHSASHDSHPPQCEVHFDISRSDSDFLLLKSLKWIRSAEQSAEQSKRSEPSLQHDRLVCQSTDTLLTWMLSPLEVSEHRIVVCLSKRSLSQIQVIRDAQQSFCWVLLEIAFRHQPFGHLHTKPPKATYRSKHSVSVSRFC